MPEAVPSVCWNATSTHSLGSFAMQVRCLAFSPDGSRFVSGSEDNRFVRVCAACVRARALPATAPSSRMLTAVRRNTV